jgi:hypothetical protein
MSFCTLSKSSAFLTIVSSYQGSLLQVAQFKCSERKGLHKQQSVRSNKHEHALCFVLLLCFILHVQHAIPWGRSRFTIRLTQAPT